MSAAVVSTSVIGSAATMIHRGFGSARATSRTWSRKVRTLAKKRGQGAHHQGQGGSQRDGPLWIPVRAHQREDGRGDHRPERGVRSEHEDPGRPDERVTDQAQDRCVETCDGRKARELGVSHPLRHQQRGEDEPCHQIPWQPPRLVVAQHRHCGDAWDPGSGGFRLHGRPPRTPRVASQSHRSWPPRSLSPPQCHGDERGHERAVERDRGGRGGEPGGAGRDPHPESARK